MRVMIKNRCAPDGPIETGKRAFRASLLAVYLTGFFWHLVLAPSTIVVAQTPQPGSHAQPASVQNVSATAAQLVTEFEVNGLKVLVKRRAVDYGRLAGCLCRP